LGNIRETVDIIHVLRCFDDPNVVHVDGSVDPVRDKEIIDIELQLKDLESIEARLSKVQRAAKSGDKDAKRDFDFMTRIKEALEQGRSARTELPANEDEANLLADLQLLTAKKVLYVCNVEEGNVATGNAHSERVREVVALEGAEILVLGAAIEADISELETYEERQMFLKDLGLDEPGVSKLIKAAYKMLNLQTYFTAGVKEVRAWTIHKGDTAPQAAGVIHSDFEKGFIRAEVIKYNDYVTYKSEAAVKDAGKLGVEGKEYIVQDGDVMHFRFNV
jgi:GTP-binding protein YchF